MVAIASIELAGPVEQKRVIESAAGIGTGRAVARPVNAAIQRGPCAATNTRRMLLAARIIVNTCAARVFSKTVTTIGTQALNTCSGRLVKGLLLSESTAFRNSWCERSKTGHRSKSFKSIVLRSTMQPSILFRCLHADSALSATAGPWFRCACKPNTGPRGSRWSRWNLG